MKKLLNLLIIALFIVAAFSFSACVFDGDKDNLYSNAAEENEAIFDIDNTIGAETETPINSDNLSEENLLPTEEESKESADLFSRVDILLKATVTGLNVRSAPSSSASVIGSLSKGDLIGFYGEENGWYTTFYKEKRGYVSAKYCEVMQFSKGDDRTEKVVEEGKKLLGYPYVWGSQRYHWGNGKINTNFVQGKYDCSALMLYIFYKADKTLLNLTSREQANQGEKVDKTNLKRGDLMFFTNSSRKDLTGIERVGHVGLYLGNNYILHTASDYACIEEISVTRWSYFMWGSRV